MSLTRLNWNKSILCQTEFLLHLQKENAIWYIVDDKLSTINQDFLYKHLTLQLFTVFKYAIIKALK